MECYSEIITETITELYDRLKMSLEENDRLRERNNELQRRLNNVERKYNFSKKLFYYFLVISFFLFVFQFYYLGYHHRGELLQMKERYANQNNENLDTIKQGLEMFMNMVDGLRHPPVLQE
jgi:hypothetical protein